MRGTSSDVAPILWQYGALARLKKHEKISRLLYDGYSTISLGYAGLYECVKFMTGHSHSDEGVGEEFGLKVMQALNDKCNQWKEEENIDYSLYGTPLESTTYKFAKSLKNRFGKDVFVKIDGKQNMQDICKLCKEIKDKFPEKKIWLYSGYQYESLSREQFKVLLFVDVLVDGRYDETLKNPSLKFRGSSNQRVINIPETLKQNKVILYCD